MDSAPFVAIGAALVAMTACAISVFAWWKTSRLAARLRSMNSLQGELLEIRDYIGKVDRWAKRINAREVMQERHATGEDPVTQHRDRGTLKDQLRRKVGLIPGKPAPHAERA